MAYETIHEETVDFDGVICYIKRGVIVRCKNCKHYDRWADGRAMNHCSKHDRLAYDDDYCSYGERKGGQAPQREDV